jgi:cytochrome c biogenesis protein CcmG/thiol:disulfide interchange protein DsbE
MTLKALGTLLLGGVMGFGLGIATGQLAPPAPQEAAPASSTALQNRQAPDFTLPGAKASEAIQLAAYQGKVVLLNFFETGCPHCHEEIPALVKLRASLHDQGVEVIGVALDPVSAKELSGLAKELSVSYPLARGNEEIANLYGGIQGVPTSFVIDRKGRIVQVFPGAVGYTALEQAIRRLL